MNRLTIYTLAFFSGASIMTLEILAGRMLSPYFGNSVYVWGSTITVFMLALAGGYLLGGRWSLQSPTLTKYASLFAVSGLFVLGIIGINEAVMVGVFRLIEDPRYGSLLAAILLFVPATVVMGMISPYSVRLLVTSSETAGSTSGRLYFVSTLGSGVGTLLTSFYWVLWLEVTHILFLCGVLMLMLSLFTGLLQAKQQHFQTSRLSLS